LPMRVVQGCDDQILQHLDIFSGDDLGIDLQRLHLLGAVDDNGDHAAAGVALDAQIGHLLLQALLHLLRLLHHLLDVHISSTSRISAGKTSRSAWIPGSPSACSRSADFFRSLSAAAAAGSPAPFAAAAISAVTVIFRPASFV